MIVTSQVRNYDDVYLKNKQIFFLHLALTCPIRLGLSLSLEVYVCKERMEGKVRGRETQ